MIESAQTLSPADVTAVLQFVDDAAARDGVGPMSEQALLRVQTPAPGVGHLLHREAGGSLSRSVVGYAQSEAQPDGRTVAELVVAPAERHRGVGRALLSHLRRDVPGGLDVWAHGDLPAAAALADSEGLARSRVLLQLRCSLAQALPEPQWPAGVSVRTFVTGADEAHWLKVNNTAFASHPEQGRWTLRDIEQREAQPWFDPAGFFLAESAGELVGFHWTKVHTDEPPGDPLGEVYVVGVHPQYGGKGLGRALTLAGLHHLQRLGLQEVLLYVDESNVPARKTYERLGFTRWATDVLYAAG